MSLISTLTKHKTESDKFIQKVRDDLDFTWDDRENMLTGVLNTKAGHSSVNTGELVNLVLDGASRVMAQFPTGTIQALTEDDKAKSIMMNLIHEKYIIPNANAQYDFLTKLRLWDIYSRVFGSMPALVDYRVDDEYVGPDLWLIHPRSFFPQAGAVNIDDMEFCQVSTWVSLNYLKSKQKKANWKNLNELILKVKENAKKKSSQADKYVPVNERDPDFQAESGDFAQCELLTEYRKNRWITYAPTYDIIIRDIPNPQKNNELPIVMKECFPLIDRLYGLAEFERGATLQKATNSLVSLYMDGVQMSIFPPVIVNSNDTVLSSVKYQAKSKWLVTAPNAISQLNIAPKGMESFSSTYAFLKSQILNLGATTDTTVSKNTDPGQGKTPEALKMQSAREGARDAWDRFMMERALEKVNQKFIDLLTTKQPAPIPIQLFKSDIDKLKEQYPDEDVSEVFGNSLKVYESGNAGEMKISKNELSDGGKNKFKYTIDPGSTMKKNNNDEHSALIDLMGLIFKFPQALDQIEQTGKFKIGDKTFDFGEALKRYVITSGVEDSEKIIQENKEGEDGQKTDEQDAKLNQAIQQIQQQMQQAQQQTEQQIQQLDEKIAKKNTKQPSETLNYKDAPDDVKREIERQAGLNPSQMGPDEDINQIHNINSSNNLQ